VKADYWLICDGPVHQSRRQQIYFGARGIISLDLTVYGPRRELHSGHYGNWAPNPALMLAQLLASMKDDAGHVRIAGFYDSSAPLGAEERAAMAAEPAPDEALKRELWLGRTENPPRKLIEAINEPSLNIRGLRSAATGAEARNVIPADATASIDVRLVKGNDPRAMFALVRAHIERRGYFVVDRDPTAEQRLSHAKVAKLVLTDPGYRAVRTPMNSPAARSVMQAVESLHPDVVKMPTLGGSVPLALIEDVVQVPLIGVPIANHDNRQHSANENLRLKNLWDGIELFAVLFTAEP
jgi:acetylornithine deacetylase/succinyl-diaminopimelate desuccinylase-like protein